MTARRSGGSPVLERRRSERLVPLAPLVSSRRRFRSGRIDVCEARTPIPVRFTHFGKPPAGRKDWRTLKSLLPYLLEFRGRVVLALVFLAAAKVANVSVP